MRPTARQLRSGDRDRLPSHDRVLYTTFYLILSFAGDAGSDSIPALHHTGPRSRLCTSILEELSDDRLVAYPDQAREQLSPH